MNLTDTIKLTLNFDIIDLHGSFALLFEGEKIAIFTATGDGWKQTSGNVLPKNVQDAVVYRIEAFYDTE